jgi:hypothetical protein
VVRRFRPCPRKVQPMVTHSRSRRPPIPNPDRTPRWVFGVLILVAVIAVVLVVVAMLRG